NQLTKTGVGISIGRTRCWDSACKFGVAKCGKSTREAADQIQNDDTRAAPENGFAQAAETARTDDCRYAEKYDIPNTQNAEKARGLVTFVVVLSSEKLIHTQVCF